MLLQRRTAMPDIHGMSPSLSLSLSLSISLSLFLSLSLSFSFSLSVFLSLSLPLSPTHTHTHIKGRKGTHYNKAKKSKQKKDAIELAEEQRKKVLQVLSERKPVSFSLLEDKDLEELSHRVIVRELEPGEEVMKYADDCSPALLHCPDTEEGWPVLAMGSAFFIVMHGILDVLTEYSEKGEPVTRGKMTRGCVFGEVLPCWAQCGRTECRALALLGCWAPVAFTACVCVLHPKKHFGLSCRA